MFDYFYHQRIRKAVATFGSLFNDVNIVRKNSSGETISQVKVPLSYGPQRSFLDRIQQTINGEDTERTVAIKLPRMSFEITAITYDQTRQVSKMNTQTVIGEDGTVGVFRQSAPYNLSFQLSIYAKSQDDALQCVEQIIPYFNPVYSVSIKPFENYPEIVEDTPISLTSVDFSDDYEGSLEQRRTIVYTLSFDMKVNFYTNINESSAGLIQDVIVNYGDLTTEEIFETCWYTGSRVDSDSDGSVETVIREVNPLFFDDIGVTIQSYSNVLTQVSSAGIGTSAGNLIVLDSDGKIDTSLFPDTITQGLLDSTGKIDTQYLPEDIYEQLGDLPSGIVYQSNLTSLTSSLIPESDGVYDLGSPTKQWKDLHLTGSTIYLNGVPLSVDSAGTMILPSNVSFTDDQDVNINLATQLYTECMIPVTDHQIQLSRPAIGDIVYNTVRMFDSAQSEMYDEVRISGYDSSDRSIIYLEDDFVGYYATVTYLGSV